MPSNAYEDSKRMRLSVVPSHLLAVKDVSDDYLEILLRGAESMKNLVENGDGSTILANKVLALVFYEVYLELLHYYFTHNCSKVITITTPKNSIVLLVQLTTIAFDYLILSSRSTHIG